MGAIIAGFVSVALVSAMGWRSIFLVGGGLSLTMLLLVWWRLPESLAFILNRRPDGALARANVLLGHMQMKPLEQLPQTESNTGQGGKFFDVFTPEYRVRPC